MTTGQGGDLPAALAEIVADFQALSERDRLQLLLEFSHQLPNPPERLLGVNCKMEPVTECQSPLFLMVELDRPDDPGTPVRLFFDAPAEAPTTRGFAEILRAGLDGLPAGEVLAVPDDVPSRLGLTAAVSPLRLNGMSGMLARIKRQIRDKGSVPAPRAGAATPAAGADGGAPAAGAKAAGG